MKLQYSLTPAQLPEFLLNVAVVRPVFIWGPPGIGKSALVEKFAQDLGMPCQSLLGSQIAPEDIIGIPQIKNGKSVFCPPENIARDHPYCLFLDELNGCSQEVQRAFYSLIHERRLGNYSLPKGSVIIGAGNRAEDAAIVKPISSALINRMVHISLQSSTKDWLTWAHGENIHPKIISYIEQKPHHLFSQPPKTQDVFSTPRSWHMLSDAMHQTKEATIPQLRLLAQGTLTAEHASQFIAFLRISASHYRVEDLFKGSLKWPAAPEDRDILYYLAESFRDRAIRSLPKEKPSTEVPADQRKFTHTFKRLLKELVEINAELAQMVVQSTDTELPSWMLLEISRDIPRLLARDNPTP